MDNIADRPAAICTDRRFIGGKGTKGTDQGRRVRHHVTVGKIKMRQEQPAM
ncbi:hypothetical protein [Sphingomonas mucosissima]|uniref:hypothetical protein n=1 Tax=Sphingomonas mucosissima TaxID=370959 RepID=UPI001B80D847